METSYPNSKKAIEQQLQQHQNQINFYDTQIATANQQKTTYQKLKDDLQAEYDAQYGETAENKEA